ncbi:MAG: DUF3108 domain-containing protein [Hyphomicrobiaceae bacterium]
MMNPFQRFCFSIVALFALVVSSLAAAPAARAEDERARPAPVHFPTRVNAVYTISWNGVELGEFAFSSSLKGNRYSMRGDTSLSALFGAFSWRGMTKSAGTVSGVSPTPVSYNFRFEGNDKSGRIDMAFQGGQVRKVTAQPPIGSSPGRVPVTRGHLTGVLDPLSAVMAISASTGASIEGVNPCKRRIPIFDGKQRFDLVLSYLRKERIEGGKGGAGFAYVCKIKYVPVAGHKMNQETRYMASNDGIEIWLIPVAKANLFVPHLVVLPTWAGNAQIMSSRVDIEMAGRGRVALVN